MADPAPGSDADPDLASTVAESAPPLVPPGAGLRLGKWLLLSELGRGSQGAVYRARDPAGRPVALKVLVQLNERLLGRFRREAAVTASLDHPGIVGVVDSGEVDGHPFIAYELLEGAVPLSRALAALPLLRRVELIEEAARALGHAHRRGLVHRDVKGSNLLLCADGRVRVIDFGLAGGGELERLTRTGFSLGTPTHMAPEMVGARREAMGPPTDVWGLGVVLYQALTGELPFTAPGQAELGVAILEARPRPPRELDPAVPPSLEAICLRALEKEPRDRFATGDAMAEALGNAVAILRGEPAPPTPRPTRLTALAGALAAGSVLLAAGALAWRASAGDDRFGPLPGRGSQGEEPPLCDPPAPPPVPPAWALALAPELRPPHPLPAGLAATGVTGEVVCAKDGSLLVWIAPASFPRGSAERPDEGPVRQVAVPGFFLARHELTWGRYARHCAAVGKSLPSRRIADYAVPFSAGDEHPVFNVRWADAQEYCAWAGLRLPREVEWERAARGPEGRTFPWGNDPPDRERRRANVADRSASGLVPPEWGRFEEFEDGAFFPAPVGSYPAGATPEGVFDLAGNVWEWTDEVYGPYDGEPSGAFARVCRGGAWDNRLEYSRAARRGRFDAERAAPYLGFRVAR